MKYCALILSSMLVCISCGGDLSLTGERNYGLAKSQTTGGPRVIYDVLAKPLPEIPLPNDQATRIDITSATGRRVNVSLNAPTDYERRARAEFDRMDGFGTFAPIFVSFDALVDLDDLYTRHANDDFRDDAVFVLNVSPECSRFGEEVALDMGRGRYPINLYGHDELRYDPLAPDGYLVAPRKKLYSGGGWRNPLFAYDNQGAFNNIIFPERNEDLNGNGRLDAGEDADQDGVLDVANFRNPTACDDTHPRRCVERSSNDQEFKACLLEHDQCVSDNLMTYYERETNTLILRPVWPLEQRCTYAVVLTKRLTDEKGRAVESPFIGIHPREQADALAPISELLPRYDLSLDDVAFAWSFTTGSMTADLEALRAGLYGHGPYPQLKEEFPPSAVELWRVGELLPTPTDDDREVIDGACAGASIALFWNIGQNEWLANQCSLEADSAAIDKVFGGTFTTPYLLHDRDGIATEKYPADNNEIWRLDPHKGEIEYGADKVTFWCSLPKQNDDCEPGNPEGKPFCAPFPTMLYLHGYGSSRAEMASHMGRHAAMGQALCGLDGPGHGKNVVTQVFQEMALFELARLEFSKYGTDALIDMLVVGRDRDLNNDGVADPGADMWTADLFHTRDMVRQLALEHMQFVRLLRSAGMDIGDGQKLFDIDGDGHPDIGGPNTIIGAWGISLGGVIAGVLAGAEPGLDTVSPNAGGGGLTDVAVRSTQSGVPDAVVMPLVGPLVAGCLPIDDHQRPLQGDETGGDCLRRSDEAQAAGVMRFAFIANDRARAKTIPFAEVKNVQPGDRILLENLDNGERREGTVNARGWIRLAVAADALDPISRRPILGLTDDDVDPVEFNETYRLGDRLRLTVYRAQSASVRERIDTFGLPVSFQGTAYPVGAPLVALQEGFGFRRNGPRLRRFMGLAQSGLSSADPAVWGAHTYLEPLNTDYDPFGRRGGDTHVLMMPTAGDSNVPVNTGITMGRTAGLFGSWLRDEQKYKAEHGWREMFTPDARYGVSIDQFLIDSWTVEGNWRLRRYGSNPLNPHVIFDPDDVSDGQGQFSCGDSDWSGRNGENRCPVEVYADNTPCSDDQPCALDGQTCIDGECQFLCTNDDDCPQEMHRCMAGVCEVFFDLPRPEKGKALRVVHDRGDGTHDAFRVPVLRPAGQHGIYNAQPFRPFDADAYMVNFTLRFLGTNGREVDHVEGCDCVATRMTEIFLNDTKVSPSISGRAERVDSPFCTTEDLRICSAECAEKWGIESREKVTCVP